MKFLSDHNWGLRLLALILAIIIYHVLKNEANHNETEHDSIFQYHR